MNLDDALARYLVRMPIPIECCHEGGYSRLLALHQHAEVKPLVARGPFPVQRIDIQLEKFTQWNLLFVREPVNPVDGFPGRLHIELLMRPVL